MLTETAKLLRDDDQFAALIKQFMKDADIGIQDLQIADEKTLKAEVSELDNKVAFKESIEPGISFRHSSQDGSEVFFPRHKESSGTLRFVALLVAILKPSGRRRFVCIDELSASMHPELVRRLIRIVHSSVFNQLGNQVMFTTHDTHLMASYAACKANSSRSTTQIAISIQISRQLALRFLPNQCSL